ncbi:hypothetical protein [Ralstonia insidiosa]|jgi:hypothetical protein|nr:hypothetical protein [Ralstonia insidiosa]MBA9940561.1 hypothetical protein [Ralstonia insidiosa]MBC9968987.1 hypothetical protein [Ralstonia insidiosa]MBX3905070.1 hypothetical protein [Ralstonia insidiosa]
MRKILAIGLFVVNAVAHSEAVQVAPQQFAMGGAISLRPSEVVISDDQLHVRFAGMKSADLPVPFSLGDDGRLTRVSAATVVWPLGAGYILPQPVQTLVLKRGESEAIVQQTTPAKASIPAVSGGMTAVSVKVLHKGMQEVERNVLFREGDYAAISQRYEFPVAIVGDKINPDDYSGFWRLTINKVSFDETGAATIEARLAAREARQEATTQNVSVRIEAGAKSGLIHGANGRDYLLSVRHIDPQI